MFKIGERVVDKSTGDIGVIVREVEYEENSWYIMWETGKDAGRELWLREEEMAYATTAVYDVKQTINKLVDMLAAGKTKFIIEDL